MLITTAVIAAIFIVAITDFVHLTCHEHRRCKVAKPAVPKLQLPPKKKTQSSVPA